MDHEHTATPSIQKAQWTENTTPNLFSKTANPPPAPTPTMRSAVTTDSNWATELAPKPEAEPRPTLPLPLRSESGEEDVHVAAQGEKISLSVRDAPLNTVLSLIAEQQGLNLVTSSDLIHPVTVTLHKVSVEEALDAILRSSGCTWHLEKNIVYVSSIKEENHVNPAIQGREVRVFQLDFVSASDIEKVVQGLLSPVGNIFATESDANNSRRTNDSIVVEDLPGYMRRIEQYIAQIDQAPRQVLIEAHILEVRLSDDTTHGVNFEYLSNLSNTKLKLETAGANPLASSGMLFSIEGTQLTSLIECLQVTNNAKTLASPKVMVLNGQEAKIQIGERLGFFVTTTTQTSTLQQVEFVDVGVLLRVTPQVTADRRVVMTVQPEISTGQVNETTGLPDKSTTEVATSVILDDGRGIIIGGLIQEVDADRQSKLPIVGDLWAVGRLFGRREAGRERREIVVALVPRVVTQGCAPRLAEHNQYQRATTPLLDQNLKRYVRPTEGALPDAMKDPRRVKLRRLPDAVRNLHDPYPLPPEYYVPANSELGGYDPNSRYDVHRSPQSYGEPEFYSDPNSIGYEDEVPIFEHTYDYDAP
ncbi:secretin N-terminal domain-containing protein [Thalassoroseus pseudoceratinae]|uniref:secretin N-terminal domain-containing protein n=1 Tax=Thalassoroseus pseudoceratinae TaxID=2713176 RepID=UPI001420AC6D|nr:secretin N-terminal domain-containing protein [Thalassoroseus pseudoceratinae]